MFTASSLTMVRGGSTSWTSSHYGRFVSVRKSTGKIARSTLRGSLAAEKGLREMMSSSERSGYVAEWCPNCNTEIEMVWDVETLGYKAYCPVCGKRLMLCDACQHTPDGEYTDDCDYNTVKDTCKYNHNEEFEYLLKFAEESDLSVEVRRLQLKSLWTAYCLHRNLDVDTLQYDLACRDLWEKVEEKDTACWGDFDSFDNYLCGYLV